MDIIPKKYPERLTSAAAWTVKDPDGLDTHCAKYDVSRDDVLALIASPEAEAAILAAVASLGSSGELVAHRACLALEKLVSRMDEAIDADKVPPGAQPKFADTLFRITGLAEERAARLRVNTDADTPKATIVILKPGDPDPAPLKAGEHRITIDLRGRSSDVIDGELVEGDDNDR